MGRVPPYLGRPGTQVPGWQPASLAHHSQPIIHAPARRATARAGEPEAWHSWQQAPSPVPLALPCPALPCLALSCLSTPLHWTGLGLASFGVGDWSPFQNRPCRRRFVLSSPNPTGASLDKASTCNLAALYRPSSPLRHPQPSLQSLESSPWPRHLSLSPVATPPAARDEGVTRLGQSQLSHLEVRFPPQRSTPSSTPCAAHCPAKHNSPHPSAHPSTQSLSHSVTAQLTHNSLPHLPAHLPARPLPHSRSRCDLNLTLDPACLLTMPAAPGIQILARRQYVHSFAQLTIHLSLPLPHPVFPRVRYPVAS